MFGFISVNHTFTTLVLEMPEEEFEDEASIFLIIQQIIQSYLFMLLLILQRVKSTSGRKRKRRIDSQAYSMLQRIPLQVQHLNRIIGMNDVDCITNLRMDRNTFGRLCGLLRQLGGLDDGKYVSVEEQVASFLSILAHHKNIELLALTT